VRERDAPGNRSKQHGDQGGLMGITGANVK